MGPHDDGVEAGTDGSLQRTHFCSARKVLDSYPAVLKDIQEKGLLQLNSMTVGDKKILKALDLLPGIFYVLKNRNSACQVTTIRCSESNLSSEDSELLREHPEIKEVELHGVNDNGLKLIAFGCPNVQELNLDGTTTTDVGVKRLVEGCKKVQKISLWQTGITDDGLRAIGDTWSGLQYINLSYCPVGDKGMVYLTEKCKDL